MRIHSSSLIKTEKILNRPIIKFYNGDDINMIAAELQLTATMSTSFYKKHNLIYVDEWSCSNVQNVVVNYHLTVFYPY